MHRIGVFDSGIGGLTVLRQLRRAFPQLDMVYLGDTARVPYGGRSVETITHYAEDDVRFLLRKDVEAIVIACGTVSSNSLDALRESGSTLVLIEDRNQTGCVLPDGYTLDGYTGSMVKGFWLNQTFRARYQTLGYSGAEEIVNMLYRAVVDRGMTVLWLTPLADAAGACPCSTCPRPPASNGCRRCCPNSCARFTKAPCSRWPTWT